MVWLLELGLVLVLFGGALSFWRRAGRPGRDRDSMTTRRVEAYMQTIRRERSNTKLTAMSDTELRDVLLSAAHNLKVQRERNSWILLGVGAVGLLSAILMGTQNGSAGFAIALGIAAIVLYGLNEFLTRRMREPLLAQGLDIDRLRVE
jgi:hypothetical protein